MNPLLTRRQTLQSLAYTTVFGGSLLGLVGCGGSGGGHRSSGGGPDVKLVTAPTPVELPTGFPLPTSELKAGTAFGSSPLSGATFDARLASNGATLAYVQHAPSGKFVLFGVVGAGRPGVTPLASAALLIAMALGLTGLDKDTVHAALGLLEAESGVRRLADTISATLVSDPFCLSDGNATIADAVKSAVEGLGAGRAQRLLSRASRTAGSTQLLVSPSDAQGGARINQVDDAQIQPANEKRRPIAVYTYRVGHTPGDGAGSSAPAERIDAQPYIRATDTLTAQLVTLNNQYAWEPIDGNPVGIELSGDDERTHYESVVLMASSSGDGEPSFFSDARYASEVAEWRERRSFLNRAAWISGVLFDIFKSALGGVATALSLSELRLIIARFESLEGAAAQNVYALIERGAFGEATKFFLEKVVAGDVTTAGYREMALRISGLTEAEAASAITSGGARLLAVEAAATIALTALLGAGLVTGLIDIGTTLADLSSSPPAARWQITAVKPKVKISPDKGDVRAGGSLGLSVTLLGFPGTTATYTWTLAGSSFGTLTGAGGDGGSGKTITTAGTGVTFATTPSDPEGQVVTVTVEAKDKATGKSLGTDKATLTVKANTPVTESATYKATYYTDGATAKMVADVSFSEVPGATYYVIEGTGGNDPYYYHDHIRVTYDPKNPPNNDYVTYSFRVGLSAIGGAAPGDSAGWTSYLDSRFLGFTFTATAYFT